MRGWVLVAVVNLFIILSFKHVCFVDVASRDEGLEMTHGT